jgi:L-serine/L-threonine ammonia-lyase
MGSLILHHIQNPHNAHRQLHFFINSGGNAGLAAVCAARSLSYPCTVVLPLTASRLMVDKLRAAGATQVIQHGETIAAAGEYMRDVVMQTPSPEADKESSKQVVKIALHPFDHEAIWAGNSSIIDELACQLPPFEDDDEEGEEEEEEALPIDAIICSVGGGGLMNGLIQGIERHRRRQKKDIHILAVETDGTQSMNLAMSAGALVTMPKITSMAVSLACVRVSEKTFEYCLSPPAGIAIHSAVLSDADAARGCLRLADDERMLVELACGVCIEAAIGDGRQCKSREKRVLRDEGYYGADDEAGLSVSCSDSGISSDAESDVLSASCLKELVPGLTRESRVVIVVCGGSNVTTGMASEWREKLANGWV